MEDNKQPIGMSKNIKIVNDIIFTYASIGYPVFIRENAYSADGGINPQKFSVKELRKIADYMESNPECSLYIDGSKSSNDRNVYSEPFIEQSVPSAKEYFRENYRIDKVELEDLGTCIENIIESYALLREQRAVEVERKKWEAEVSMKIKEYAWSLNTPDNKVYQDNELLIMSCFNKSLEIIENNGK